jgi:transketolase
MTAIASRIDELCINTIRALAMDAVQKAGNGHPGAPMGCAPMAYALWTRFLQHNPADPDWPNRDRFVLSNGHASMLLYALLHLTGYDLPLDEIKNLRQLGSRTPGHPEHGLTPGVELTTGPLGAGFAMGVGMAIAERWLAATYNRPGHTIIDHYTYGICSDGDLMEGVASEAASLAGHLGLGKLIYLYDDNGITIDGPTSAAFSEDAGKRFEAYGWHVQHIDGEDVEAVTRAIESARAESGRPSLIAARTTIGHGAPNKGGTADAHGAALGPDEVRLAKEALGWPLEPPFHIPGDALEHFRHAVEDGRHRHADWEASFAAYEADHPVVASELRTVFAGDLPDGWDADLPEFELGAAHATRSASGKTLQILAKGITNLLGGSADLTGSNNTEIAGSDWLSAESPAGRNIHFGVREHAMANICNGIALHGGLMPYCGTFLTFSDYMRPALRLAAIQACRNIFVFTHDSIGLGEDGPTHQPIEHLASLRAMPGLTVIRPADANETVTAWKCAIKANGPVALVLTRQNVPVVVDAVAAKDVARGGYAVAGHDVSAPDVLLFATGSEVSIALDARDLLASDGVSARVISLPSWELFAAQPDDYRERVAPASVRARVSVEAAATLGWERFVGDAGETVGLDHYGASAPYQALYDEFGITAAAVAEAARRSIARARAT